MKDDLLRKSASAHGIETGYWDIEGRFHEAHPDILRACLRAMGVAASDPDGLRASIFEKEERDWLFLPPVSVAWEDEVTVVFHIPCAISDRSIRWRIDMETGDVLTGDLKPETLSPVEVRTIKGVLTARYRVAIPAIAPGYHRFHLESGVTRAGSRLIVAPRRCYLPPNFSKSKLFGLSIQLYGIRSEHNGGFGNFSDLHRVAAWAGACGAHTIGINPLHATFFSAPDKFSPYTPNSRLFLNPLYLDAGEIAAFHDVSPALIEPSVSEKTPELIAYGSIAQAKREVLNRLFDYFQDLRWKNPAHPQAIEFQNFCRKKGEMLRLFALFETLAEEHGTYAWRTWPVESPVQGTRRKERVAFFQYLQWHADRQLAKERGKSPKPMLYGDLAVSGDPDGFDVWLNRDLFAENIRIGAPPDPFNADGQEWGVVPLCPHRLRDTGYAYVSNVLRANMQRFDALRIDHVMGFERLFWVPAGVKPADGTYVRYSREESLAVLALESQRNRCVVVGEDLGTVPEGLRPRLRSLDALSYSVLYFERIADRFRAPAEYSELAVACATTHDLPTIKGFWNAADLRIRFDFGLLDEGAYARALAERVHEKRLLVEALVREGLMPEDEDSAAAEFSPALTEALHRYLSRSRANLVILQLEDLVGEEMQANLPGTVHEYPNWQRRVSRSLEDIECDDGIAEAIAAIKGERAAPS